MATICLELLFLFCFCFLVSFIVSSFLWIFGISSVIVACLAPVGNRGMTAVNGPERNRDTKNPGPARKAKSGISIKGGGSLTWNSLP